MFLRHWPVWWPWRSAGAIRSALPNAACPGLLRKPLDTAIGRLLAPLPQRPPGQQANKQQSTNTPKQVAMLMAAAMRQYNTAHITQWRRSRALLEATGCRHRVSIMSNNINQTWLRHFFLMFSSSNRRKRSRVDAKTPVFSRGMTYQTKEKGLTKVSIEFVGGDSSTEYDMHEWLLYCVCIC